MLAVEEAASIGHPDRFGEVTRWRGQTRPVEISLTRPPDIAIGFRIIWTGNATATTTPPKASLKPFYRAFPGRKWNFCLDEF